MKTITMTEVNEIERYKKLDIDLHNNKRNTRTKIYEIDKFKKYCLIHYHNGIVTNVCFAQNSLTLLLKFNY